VRTAKIWIAGLVLCTCFLLPGALAGQDAQTGTLSGRVLDRATRKPVGGARIVLEGLGREGISNDLGRFAISAVPAGMVRVRVERLGYAQSRGEVEIEPGEVTGAILYLSIEAVPLDPIVVTTRRREANLPPVEGFERRYYSGRGRFVLEDDIRKRNPTKLVEVLRETGLEVTGNATSVMLARENCTPTVYVDGVKVTHPHLIERKLEPPPELQWPDPTASPAQEAAYNLSLIHPSSVVAVEVYRSALETPGEFADLLSHCGAIVVWTRRGMGLGEAGNTKGRSVWKRGLMAVGLGALAMLVQSIF
jgi:hypothetical protein